MNHQIELHIEELVLHGFSTDRRNAIAQAIQIKLTQLITEQHIPAALQHDGIFPSVNAGTIHIDNGCKSEVTGNKIANAVYKSFKT